MGKICASCGTPVAFQRGGWIHTPERPGCVEIIPVRPGTDMSTAVERSPAGRKRPSGAAALHTFGDGRRVRVLGEEGERGG